MIHILVGERSRKARSNMEFGGWKDESKRNFIKIQGKIVDIQAMAIGELSEGCAQLITLAIEDGNVINFVVLPTTYIVYFQSLSIGMNAMFFYDPDAPIPLIYPPRYNAVAGGEVNMGQYVAVSYFDRDLISLDNSLEILLNDTVPIRTVNNQEYLGNPANRYLLVVYDRATRSLPARTVPLLIVILCNL